jgi:dTMP kinase
MSCGVFITLEGGEGSGKSTLAKHLGKFLTSNNIHFILTREPGGSPEAEAIRSLVVSGDKDRFDPTTEALLFNAARRHHLKNQILPALASGIWVICDRFVDSTFVYQGLVQGVDLAFLKSLHSQACDDIFPDLTFLLDIPVDIGLFRATRRASEQPELRFEQKGYQFHETVRQGFVQMACKYQSRFCVLDGTKPEEDVLSAAIAQLKLLIHKQ